MYLNLCDVIQREPTPSTHPETRQLALLGTTQTRHRSFVPPTPTTTRPSTTGSARTGIPPPSALRYGGRGAGFERDSRTSLAYADYRPSTAPSKLGSGSANRPSISSTSSTGAGGGGPVKKKVPAPYVPAYPPPIKKEKKTKERNSKAARWFGIASESTSTGLAPLAITTTVTTTTSTTSPVEEKRISSLDISSESGNGRMRDGEISPVGQRPYEFYPRRHHPEERGSNESTPMSTTVRFSMPEDGVEDTTTPALGLSSLDLNVGKLV